MKVKPKTLLERRLAGQSLREIGEEFGISYETVRIVLKENFGIIPKVAISTHQAAKQLGCSEFRIRNLVIKLGVKKGSKKHSNYR